MVRFTPRPIKENVNISKISPKREFLVLFLGLVGILVVCYFCLGVTLNFLIDKMPSKVEHVAGKLFHFKESKVPEKFSAVRQETQQLLDSLTVFLPDPSSAYTIHIVDREDANAFAMPGNHIVLFSGLLTEVESQNELAMVLAHELGHYANRDHLRAMGRGIVFVVISAVLFGADSSMTNVVGGALSTVEMKFSRQQEAAADRFAIELINKKYGHVAGSIDFFKRIEEKRKIPKFLGFFLTHPMGSQRIDMLNTAILKLNYTIGDKTPLSAIFEEQLKEEEDK